MCKQCTQHCKIASDWTSDCLLEPMGSYFSIKGNVERPRCQVAPRRMWLKRYKHAYLCSRIYSTRILLFPNCSLCTNMIMSNHNSSYIGLRQSTKATLGCNRCIKIELKLFGVIFSVPIVIFSLYQKSIIRNGFRVGLFRLLIFTSDFTG